MHPESERTLEIRKEALLTGVRSTVDQFSNPTSGFRDKDQAFRLYRDAIPKLQDMAGRELPPGVEEAKFLEAIQLSIGEIRTRIQDRQQQVLDHLSDDPMLVRRAIEQVLSENMGQSLDSYQPPEKKVSLAGTREGRETSATVDSVKSAVNGMAKGRTPAFVTLVESVNILMDRRWWGIDFERKRQFRDAKSTPAGQYEDKILQGMHAGVDGLYQVFAHGDPQLVEIIAKDPSGFASRLGNQIRAEARAREAAERAKTTDV